MNADANCRSCKAPIRWCVTDATGKRMPIDPEPVADGNIWVIRHEDGMPVIGVALTRDGVPASEPFAYVSHFVNCPDRDSWRKK